MIKVLYKEVELDMQNEVYQMDVSAEINGTKVEIRYYGYENNIEIMDFDEDWDYEEVSEAIEAAPTNETFKREEEE